jgi:hypothetical protein
MIFLWSCGGRYEVSAWLGFKLGIHLIMINVSSIILCIQRLFTETADTEDVYV